MSRKFNRTTQKWKGKNGNVVTYKVGDDKPDLPEPDDTSGMQLRAYTTRKNIGVKPKTAGFGAPRKRRKRSKPDGVTHTSETPR